MTHIDMIGAQLNQHLNARAANRKGEPAQRRGFRESEDFLGNSVLRRCQ